MATTYQVRMTIDEDGRRQDIATAAIDPGQTGKAIMSGVLSVVHTSATEVPLGPVTTPGWAMFRNLDATNYVNLGYDDTGFVAVMKIGAGQCVVVSLDAVLAAPYVQAAVATCLLDYTILNA